MTVVEEMEQKRLTYLRTITRWWVGFVVALASYYLLSKIGALNSWLSFVVFGIIIGLAVTAAYKSFQGFATPEDEKKLFGSMVEEIMGSHINYEPKQGYSEATIRSLDMFQYFGANEGFFAPNVEYHTEDKIEGEWDGINFEIADIRMSYITSNGKNSQTHIIFDGILIQAKYPWDFDGVTRVYPKWAEYQNTSGEVVNLESPEFAKTYNVYTSNQTGSRMALQTDIMDVMMEFGNGKWLSPYYAFVGSSVWIGIPAGTLTSSWMDLTIFSPVATQLEGSKHLLQKVAKMMKALKLHHVGNRVVR
jgi:Protein of unknown function (DUF3137)